VFSITARLLKGCAPRLGRRSTALLSWIAMH